MNLSIHLCVGRCYCFARRFGEALDRLRATLDMEPGNLLTHVWLAHTLNAMDAHQEALEVVEAAITRFGREARLLLSLGRTYAALGRRAEAHEVVEELRGRGGDRYAPYLALAMAVLAETHALVESMNTLYEERSGWLAYAAVVPWWDRARADPRLRELLVKMRLDS